MSRIKVALSLLFFFNINLCNAEKLTCIGNSITLHPPKVDIGWNGNWGMAASAQAKDYCHILGSKLSKLQDINLSVEAVNISKLENSPFVTIKQLSSINFSSDYIVIFLGDNLKMDGLEDIKTFSDRINLLLNKIDFAKSKVFIVGTWWYKKDIDKVLLDIALSKQAKFVSLKGLANEKKNLANFEQNHINKGVGLHPSDIGMEHIANAIMQQF